MNTQAFRVALVISGKTSDEVARETGLSAWQVSRIANGHLKPKPHQAAAIAAAVGKTVETIFGEEAK
jgi:DNA-binding XRE family transcriptional regulator